MPRSAAREPAPRRAVAVAVALLATAAGACAPKERLVLGDVQQQPGLALVVVANAGDAFRDAGVEVELRHFAVGRDALRALLAGEVDVAIAYETPVVLAALGGARPRILTRLHRAERNTVVLARGDRHIEHPEDLRGKRVGVVRDTNSEFVLDSLLAQAGVADREVATVDLEAAALVPAIVRGDVDAVGIWSPLAQRAERELGPSRARVLASDTYTEASLLLTRDDVLAQRRPALVRLLRALAATEAALAADRDLALPALERALPDVDPADLRKGYALVTPQLALDHLLLALLDAEAKWFVGEGRAAGRPPWFADLLAPSLLDEVEPEAVTVEVPR